MSEAPEGSTTATDGTRAGAIITLFVAIAAIAAGYVAAFRRAGTPQWAPWCLAVGVPVALGAIMVLGAARGRRGVGRLKIPFAFVVVTLAIGFGAALALPATEGPLSRLWLGLPLRAAIVIYGVGLLPIFVLPIAYALTFDTQTLSAEDVERVRALAREREKVGTDAVPNE
jgi:prepilin signal peptidase PulO-like enzyme (type II secretory pathway)